MPKKNAPQKTKPNPRETVYMNDTTIDLLRELHEKYHRRTKSDIINAGIECLYILGYKQGLDGNLLPPHIEKMKNL